MGLTMIEVEFPDCRTGKGQKAPDGCRRDIRRGDPATAGLAPNDKQKGSYIPEEEQEDKEIDRRTGQWGRKTGDSLPTKAPAQAGEDASCPGAWARVARAG